MLRHILNYSCAPSMVFSYQFSWRHHAVTMLLLIVSGILFLQLRTSVRHPSHPGSLANIHWNFNYSLGHVFTTGLARMVWTDCTSPPLHRKHLGPWLMIWRFKRQTTYHRQAALSEIWKSSSTVRPWPALFLPSVPLPYTTSTDSFCLQFSFPEFSVLLYTVF